MRTPLCAHPDFDVHATVIRLEDVGRFTAEVHVRCAECRVRFRWLGLAMGSSPAEPMTSPDGFELRAPVEPDAHGTSMLAGTEFGFPTTTPTPERDGDG